MDVFRRNNKKTANTSNGNTYQPATKGGHKQQGMRFCCTLSRDGILLHAGGYHHWGPGDPASDIDDDNAPVVPLDKAIPTKKTAPPPEINLIDTSIPDVVSVPAPSVVFDPLVMARLVLYSTTGA
ncbi:hypothetical protein DYB32_003440 [Aphanomyces invadans]|uniref:Uncharacterized protein n=1 Tax=Aphanomyces invadans TaxID=157072 RepID=A0A3R7AB81_9STRA|nr:hypothetical protein DYB32_003440 [Aphanomyces invadans]